MKLKVMQINCFYRYGSTGRITADIHAYLKARGHESVVCYGRRPVAEEAGVYCVSGAVEARVDALRTHLFGGGFAHASRSTARILSLIERKRPDVVHLHCLNGHFVHVYRLMDHLKTHRIPTVLTLHADLMYTAGCGAAGDCDKWRTPRGCHDCARVSGLLSRLWRDDAARAHESMRSVLQGFENLFVVGVSPWMSQRAMESSVFAGRQVQTVMNGVDVSAFRPRPDRVEEMRRHLGLCEGERVLLHVTPHFRAAVKGGEHILTLSERLPDCRFVIVGWDGTMRTLPAHPGGGRWPTSAVSRLIPFPHTSDRDVLATLYTMADLTLMVSRQESFSMVLAESLCCGTPVMGFSAGGPESVAIPGGAGFVPQGDTKGLLRAVRAYLSSPPDIAACESMARVAAAAYTSRRMGEAYLDVYRRAVRGENGHSIRDDDRCGGLWNMEPACHLPADGPFTGGDA